MKTSLLHAVAIKDINISKLRYFKDYGTLRFIITAELATERILKCRNLPYLVADKVLRLVSHA